MNAVAVHEGTSSKTSKGEVVRSDALDRAMHMVNGPYEDADMEALRVLLRTATRSKVFSGSGFRKLLRADEPLTRDGASTHRPNELWALIGRQVKTVLASEADDAIKTDQRRELLESMATLQRQRELVAAATRQATPTSTTRLTSTHNCS